MSNFESLKGWNRHNHFGLRQEWLELYLDFPDDWENRGHLGNRQVDALRVWLKTAGLHDQKGNETFLCDIFREKGIANVFPWELLWVNVVHNFPTAEWYVMLSYCDFWTTSDMIKSLLMDVNRLRKATVQNAILELVGLLERTPVGKDLKQGEVIPSRPRQIKREGLSHPSSQAVFYAAIQLFLKNNARQLNIHDPHPWPWKIFGCNMKDVIQKFILDGEPYFTITHDQIHLKRSIEESSHVLDLH